MDELELQHGKRIKVPKGTELVITFAIKQVMDTMFCGEAHFLSIL
jgi:hypothetical protein